MAEARGDPKEIRIRRRLAELEAEREALERQLADLRRPSLPIAPISNRELVPVTAASSASVKISLFQRLFAGRPDVFPVRWENSRTNRFGYAPACANEWVKDICGKPQVKCGECPSQAFIPVSDQTIERHLRGEGTARGQEFVAGVYPLLSDDTCHFLAADFDGELSSADALAYLHTCRAKGIPAALERSRSGAGYHVWIFFSEAVLARDARRLGAWRLTDTMDRRPEVGFASYDRFFPSQHTLPIGGFGNLLALALQRRARMGGNSMFVDDNLKPYDDQWAFLSSLGLMSPRALAELVHEADARGRVLAIRMPVDDEAIEEPWLMPPSRWREQVAIADPVPERVSMVLADGIYIDRSRLPPSLVTALIHLAAFQNPEFYRAQAMRLSTFGKPRIIACAEITTGHVALPRGCLDGAVALLRGQGVEPDIEDRRTSGSSLAVNFLGSLRPDQQAAFDACAAHDLGVLAAPTAFGKTVVAAALIAHRKCNALVLVHRRELLTQWVERLKAFVSLGPSDIGTIGAGHRKPSGRIDVALIQSLVRKGEVSDLVEGYGHLIVAECHHLSAASFELVARRSKARFVLGLSATVTRKDGHHPIIFMQCGPVRYRGDARVQAAQREFEHQVRVRETTFRLTPMITPGRPSMPKIYAALAQDDERNALIFDDVLTALEAGRSPLVLTERRDHLETLRTKFKGFARNLIVLRGGMGRAERQEAEALLQVSDDEERLVLATGRYLGEGFDDARLDILFLTMPISWRGTLAQYVGRLHRTHTGKRRVIVYDYVDVAVPVLARMAAKRQSGYRALGNQLG